MSNAMVVELRATLARLVQQSNRHSVVNTTCSELHGGAGGIHCQTRLVASITLATGDADSVQPWSSLR
jgi:hypothetical protein